jgi:hypothetical protein
MSVRGHARGALVNGTPIGIDPRDCQGGHDIRALSICSNPLLATASALLERYERTTFWKPDRHQYDQWFFCESNSPAGCVGHPLAKSCCTSSGKPELVAKSKRHYGPDVTKEAIEKQLRYLLLQHRLVTQPQKTRPGLSAPKHVGGRPEHFASTCSAKKMEQRKSNNKKNNLKDGPLYREKCRIKKEKELLGGNALASFALRLRLTPYSLLSVRCERLRTTSHRFLTKAFFTKSGLVHTPFSRTRDNQPRNTGSTGSVSRPQA